LFWTAICCSCRAISIACVCAIFSLLDHAIGFDLRAVDLPLGGNPRLVRLALPLGLLLSDFGILRGAAHFHLTLLLEAGELGVAGNLEAAAGGVEVLGFDLDAGLLLDVVARLSAQLDLFGELGEPLGVKRVVGVEVIDRCLVEPGQRDGFKLEPVHRQIGRRDLLHFLHELRALLVELVHRHAGCDERSASTNLPSISSFRCSGCMVRRPSVWAAIAMLSRSGARGRRTRP
jgi:hypothetical protein